MQIKNPNLFLIRFVFKDVELDKRMKAIYLGADRNDSWAPGPITVVFEEAGIYSSHGEAEKEAWTANHLEPFTLFDKKWYLSVDGERFQIDPTVAGEFRVVEYGIKCEGQLAAEKAASDASWDEYERNRSARGALM